MHWIVMVAQLARDFDDFDIVDARRADDCFGRLAAGDTAARADLEVFGVSAAESSFEHRSRKASAR